MPPPLPKSAVMTLFEMVQPVMTASQPPRMKTPAPDGAVLSSTRQSIRLHVGGVLDRDAAALLGDVADGLDAGEDGVRPADADDAAVEVAGDPDVRQGDAARDVLQQDARRRRPRRRRR